MFNLQKFSAITAIGFEVFTDPVENTEESMLYVGDKMGYVRVFSLESLLRHSEIKHIPFSFKEKRRVSNKIEDVLESYKRDFSQNLNRWIIMEE